MRNSIHVSLLFAILIWACSVPPSGDSLNGKIIDLTHAFDAQTVYWPTAEEFKLEVVFKGESPNGFHYEANNFSAAEHGGTHIDAPVHFFAGRHAADEIPLDRLMGEGALIDVSSKCAADPDYQVTSGDFAAWEKAHGRHLDDLIVLVRTGFGKYWPDRVKYMGTDERGAEAVPKLHFPGLHPDAAKWLVENRKIKAIGLDTPSIDHGQSTRFQSHVTLCEHNIPAFENVANLDQLPDSDFIVIALPMKIKGGSGGPLRIVAIIGE